MACGAGFYWAAVIATAIALVGLGPLRLVSQTDRRQAAPSRSWRSSSRRKASAAPVLAALEQLGVERYVVLDRRPRRRAPRDCVVELPHGEASEDVLLRLGELEEISGVKWNRDQGARAVLAERAQARRADAGARRAGGSSCSTWTNIRPRSGRRSSRTRARRPSYGRRVGPADEWMLGEDSGLELAALGGRPGVETARWAAGSPRRARARGARRRGRPLGALRLRARRALSRRS